MALIEDDGELGTAIALEFVVPAFDEVDAFDALDDCDEETFSNDINFQISKNHRKKKSILTYLLILVFSSNHSKVTVSMPTMDSSNIS